MSASEQQFFEHTRRLMYWRAVEHRRFHENPREFFVCAELSSRQPSAGEATRELIPDICPYASYYEMSAREFQIAINRKAHQ